jgi:hypothetical protein
MIHQPATAASSAISSPQAQPEHRSEQAKLLHL